MSYIDTGLVTYRAASALIGAAERLRALVAPRGKALSRFSPAELEDIGLSVADIQGPARPIGRLLAAVRDWNLRRRTVAELSRLSDAQLHDIGLVRADIEALGFGRPLR